MSDLGFLVSIFLMVGILSIAMMELVIWFIVTQP